MLRGNSILSNFFNRTFTKRFGSSLVVIEHNNKQFEPANLNVISAAKKCGPVSALVVGSQCKSVAEQVSKIKNISKVFLIDKPELANFLPEVVSPQILNIQNENGFTHIFAPSSAFGKNIFPRAAIDLDVSPISDITGIESENIFHRSIYAGNAILKLESIDPIKFITVRSTAFAPVKDSGSNAEIVESQGADVSGLASLSTFVSQEIVKSDRPDLASAKIVVSGGRALKSKDGFKLVYDLADKLGAAVGASRAAVDAGFCSNEIQVGQTGKIVAPELYIAIGISGAIQHLAGMKDSKIIVAINKDADSAIFQVSDYGLVGDLFQIVPELTQKL